MAGRIRAEDILAVKERVAIDDVVREHVTLRRAGSALKGLCPFHDEKTPSFTVNPSTGHYHCYGCGEGGDVISFVAKVDQLTFTEAVERLAAKAGLDLRYEEGGRREDQPTAGRRARLVEANRTAQEFYAAYLIEAAEARAGRDFMRARGFDGAAAAHFGVGFAPRGGEELVRHLRGKGFTEDEVVTAGLVGRGQRGLYDRFRGRLVWPIRATSSEVLGFGARRIFDDDRIEAKYLNTTETPLYKKTTVLYGLDLARRAISQQRQAVVVEGYTDVMACHLAGVTTAVASCGTAFGGEHVTVLRRILRDEPDLEPARVIFTFDGDAAGQAAAMKAFKGDQRWASQSFVAVAPGGQDPCELRISGGDRAVAALVEDAVPMFDFALRTTIGRFDLETAEGRVHAGRAIAPIVVGIRDQALAMQYKARAAGLIGLVPEELDPYLKAARRAAQAAAAGGHGGQGAGSPAGGPGGAGPGRPGSERQSAERQFVEPDEAALAPSDSELPAALPAPDLRDPAVRAERQLLQCLLQFPGAVDPARLADLQPGSFAAPAHAATYAALAAVGLPVAGQSAAAWHAAVAEAAPAAVVPLLTELSVAPLPTVLDPLTGRPGGRYVDSLFLRVREVALTREIADALGRMRRLDAGGETDQGLRREHAVHLQELQRRLADLRRAEES